jgi:hypothetical protein
MVKAGDINAEIDSMLIAKPVGAGIEALISKRLPIVSTLANASRWNTSRHKYTNTVMMIMANNEPGIFLEIRGERAMSTTLPIPTAVDTQLIVSNAPK